MICVTGLRRSGTSMMMLALKESGIPIIGKKMANEYNPLGFWEKGFTSRGIKEDLGNVVVKVVADGFPFSDPTVIDKVIVMLRDPRIVLKSMLKGNLIREEDLEKAAEKNARDLERTLEVIWAHSIPKLEVQYEEVLKYPKENIKRVCKFLEMGNGEGYKIIDPKLNHYEFTSEAKSHSSVPSKI